MQTNTHSSFPKPPVDLRDNSVIIAPNNFDHKSLSDFTRSGRARSRPIARVDRNLFGSISSGTAAFPWGTALHKIVLQPAARYSEDLDFVQLHEEPIANAAWISGAN